MLLLYLKVLEALPASCYSLPERNGMPTSLSGEIRIGGVAVLASSAEKAKGRQIHEQTATVVFS